MRWIVFLINGFAFYSAYGATAAKLDKGNFVGGISQHELLLQDVRHEFSYKLAIERIVFEVGAVRGTLSRMGYYQVDLQNEKSRLVIVLADVSGSTLPLDVIETNLKKSLYIENVAITLDPELRSATVQIDLKKWPTPYAIKASEISDKEHPGRLAIDIKNLKATR